MPDHWHALIWTADPQTISQVLHDVKKLAARRLHQLRGTKGPVWQHQFWDRFMRHEKEYAARFDDMHLNPVRRGLVAKPEDWPWSSAREYSGSLDENATRHPLLPIDRVLLPSDERTRI